MALSRPWNTWPTAVLAVHRLRVHAIQVPHPLRKIALHGFDNKMVVIGHFSPGVTDPVEAPACLSKDVQPQEADAVIKINIFPTVASGRDVIKTASKFDTQKPCHIDHKRM